MKKFNKGTKLIKDYIGYEDSIQISEFCVERYSEISKSGDYSLLPTIKALYDILVGHCVSEECIDGIVETKDADGKVEISIDLTAEKIDKFTRSKLCRELPRAVYNYKQVWDIVLEQIRLINIENGLAKGFDSVTAVIPSGEELANTLKTGIEELKKVNAENPDLIKAIAQASQYEGAIEKATKDFAETKAKRKAVSKSNKALAEKLGQDKA